MNTFKDLKRNLKKDVSTLPIIKVSLLGDTATQFLATAIKGKGIERGYNIILFEAEYNQVERQVLDPTSDYKTPLTMEEWLGTIKHSKGLITNSYHGMIMAILNHVPFVVLVESKKYSGMNDRFNTILSQIGLIDRICDEGSSPMKLLNKSIDWAKVEEMLSKCRGIGEIFLGFNKRT